MQIARLEPYFTKSPGKPRVDDRRVLSGIKRIAALAASVDLDVLISSDTGTGKELAARAIHDSSVRSGGPFITLNCAVLPETMAETILFGQPLPIKASRQIATKLLAEDLLEPVPRHRLLIDDCVQHSDVELAQIEHLVAHIGRRLYDGA